ncbi:MAG TPA: hypothetical protein VI522_00710 [Gammaproteobacteria bacterium]|nr:hypothetical protein [Gammaproteobacteria bacterium]
MNKIKLRFCVLLLACTTSVMANNRVVLESSDDVDTSDIDELNEMMLEQNFLERLFVDKPGIVVTPYYDEYGRWGAKVVPNRGEPYYVDPYYEDAMQTNRHSDESNTSSNWRVMVW